MNYYNEIDPYCVRWLNNLILCGLIPDGHVDDRSIRDVQPGDLAGYTQCHFFAGIAGWSLALAMAEWPEGREVWTGSCPCQPFSAAGARKGFADDRHLWPEFRRLIGQRQPATIFGEQVARATDWLGVVRGDLEALEYAVGAMPIEAASVGAPHKRDRFWFVALANGHGEYDVSVDAEMASASQPVPDSDFIARHERRSGDPAQGAGRRDAYRSGEREVISLAGGEGLEEWERPAGEWTQPATAGGNWWSVEPPLGRLAHGVPARVGQLRAYGNAIVPQVAAEFIRCAS